MGCIAGKDSARGLGMKQHEREQERKCAKQAHLLLARKKFHREERKAVLAGLLGTMPAEPSRMFKNLKHVRPAQPIGFMWSIDWSAIEYATRLVVVRELNDAIWTFREQRGFEPIDEPLPGQPESSFRTIRAIVIANPARVGG
jgi:hypothetical protein